MATVVPFIMVNRCGSQNMIHDTVEIDRIEEYLREKKAQGMPNISMMHVMIAAYIRLVSQRPQLNRFIRGQRIWTRKNIEISLTIKKEMSIESPDTVVKVVLPPDATIEGVYEALDREITNYRSNPGGDFDNTAKFLTHFPSLFFKFAIHLLKTLDYFNLLPRFLTRVSPFHCSFFITSMGSLGIPPIYHHLYDFGTCPIFLAFGAKRRVNAVDDNGNIRKVHYMDFSFVLDERICDGYYYASSLRMFKAIMRNPAQLDEVPTVIPDID